MRLPILTLSALSLLSASVLAADGNGLTSEQQQYSYTLGYQIGSRLSQESLEVDPAAFAQAIQDSLSGQTSKLSPEQMTAAIKAHGLKIRQALEAKARANLEKSEAFLAENQKKEGVKVLEDGLQYEVLKTGDGPKPTGNDTVVVHYVGTLVDGTEFDSSRGRGEPATFRLKGVIPGFKEALSNMKQGDHWRVALPAKLAYGPQGAGDAIGPNEALIFDIELLEVKPAASMPANHPKMGQPAS